MVVVKARFPALFSLFLSSLFFLLLLSIFLFLLFLFFSSVVIFFFVNRQKYHGLSAFPSFVFLSLSPSFDMYSVFVFFSGLGLGPQASYPLRTAVLELVWEPVCRFSLLFPRLSSISPGARIT